MPPADDAGAVPEDGSPDEGSDRGRLSGPGHSYAVETLVVDADRGFAARGGRALRLLPKEFALLVYLAKNANQIVSREAIARAVWGDDTATWTNVITVNINGIRREIERDGLPELLHTVRGEGYCLGAPPRKVT